MNSKEFKKRILLYEKRFKQNDYRGDKTLDTFSFLKGNRDIVLIAPHSVKYLSKNKDADIEECDQAIYTGAIALYLQALTGCHAVVRNNYPCDYIKPLQSYDSIISYVKDNNLKYLIDVLELIAPRKDLYVGLGDAGVQIEEKRKYKTLIEECFKNFKVDYNLYKATGMVAISKSICERTGISTSQFLISKNFRNPTENVEDMQRFTEAFSNYITTVDEQMIRRKLR